MTAMREQPMDPAPMSGAAEKFAERMLQTLNSGALCLMVSIGHRTRLFDTLATLPPSTSETIALSAGLNERYVREWLGAMVTGGIVEYDPVRRTYRLPPDHAAFLTRRSPTDNMAVVTQFIPVLAAVEDDIVGCFENGGGVPYEKFNRFHEVMAEESGQTVLPVLRDQILPLVPGLTKRLETGIRVLDAGCGRGKALNLMASWYPKSRFTGYDLSEEAIAFARSEARELGNTNVEFVVRDLTNFDKDSEPGTFDLITTFDAIHDQGNPAGFLRGIRNSLASDGVYIAQDIGGSSHVHKDIDFPLGPMMYTISCMHCMTVSLAQEGEGLGAMWGREKALEYFADAGFDSVEVRTLEHDIVNNYYICRP